MLERPADEISLLEVIEAVEGPLTAGVPLRATFPGSAGDRLHTVLRRVTDETRKQLQAVKLSDLLRG